VVNRRLDVALSIGAGGAHLGFDALGVADARTLLGAEAMLGVSTHSLAEVEAAARAGADYVHLAPVFEPLSKRGTRPPLGPGAVRAASRCGVRVIAQGGVRERNARELVEAGAAGLAVTGAILMADDPGRAAQALRDALDPA
jgi:thiamine-phosphate pyrophosphorylase